MALASEVSIDSAKAPSMRAKASSCPLASTTEMHCGTFISVAFAIAACSSLNAPSDVSLSDCVVSAMCIPPASRQTDHMPRVCGRRQLNASCAPPLEGAAVDQAEQRCQALRQQLDVADAAREHA